MSRINDNSNRKSKWEKRKELFDHESDGRGAAWILGITIVMFGGFALYAGYAVATTLHAIPDGRLMYELILIPPAIALTLLAPVACILIPWIIITEVAEAFCAWMMANEDGDD